MDKKQKITYAICYGILALGFIFANIYTIRSLI